MIDKKAFSEAAQDADAFAGEYGLDEWLRRHDIDESALLWAVQQRALRAAMAYDGIDFATMPQTGLAQVSLSDEADHWLPILQATVLDGIAIGLTVKGRD